MPKPLSQSPQRRRGPGAWLNDHRALLMLITLYVAMAICTPNFFTRENTLTILKGASLNGIVAIGFTIVFILGQLDLSIGAVVMLAGMLAVGLQPKHGWIVSCAAGVLSGVAVGIVNGLLIVKARINSFIVTLGTLFVVTGLMQLYSKGGSLGIDDFRLGDWLDTAHGWLPAPVVLITLALVIIFSLYLNFTRHGRGFFIVGGNPETAWLAGLNRDRLLLLGFILCGGLAAVGGVIFAAELSSMTSATVLGTRTLMTVLAAVIIGGALMTGGRGSVLKSYWAVLMLTTLFNGLGLLGWGFEVQIFVNGVMLAVVVLYEAYTINAHELAKGRRPGLMRDYEEGRLDTTGGETIDGEELDPPMQKDRFPLVCVMLTAMVAIVAITAIYFKSLQHAAPETAVMMAPAAQATVATPAATVAPAAGTEATPAAAGGAEGGAKAALQAVYALRGSDNQPLVFPAGAAPQIPPRPADPKALPETDPGHWWDIEYAGWKVEKEAQPQSPANGPAGKKVILLKAGDHPYFTAYVRGFESVAKTVGMQTKVFSGNWSVDLQNQQAEQAIAGHPDMIILCPVDATACTPMMRKIHAAGIPLIAANTIPTNEAMKYCIAWTGPNDWGQFRVLARSFAEAMGKTGSYAIIRHMPGSSPFFARTFAPVTELASYAPQMKMLAMDTTNLESDATRNLVSTWLTKYGKELKGLVLCDDGPVLTGVVEAARNAGRSDLIIVAAGNSKTGMDAVKDGKATAITYQSAEGDGAIPIFSAARWFAGEKLDPVIYLPMHIITKDDVEKFMPAQW